MLDFYAIKRGGSLYPSAKDSELKFMELPDNTLIRVKASVPRSAPHHRMFFAAIAEAFTQWPEANEFQPDSQEHLRAWLICRSHSDFREALATFDLNAMNFNEMVMAFGKAAAQKRICFPRVDATRGKVYIVAPKSIAWDFEKGMSQTEFNRLSGYVSEVLKEETGLSLEDYKKRMGEWK